MCYYTKEESKLNIMAELANYGWLIEGYHEDKSDSMIDYYQPASWSGVARFNDYTLCVDIGEWNARSFGILPNPKGSAWHIEKDAKIVASGKGVFGFASLKCEDENDPLWGKLNKLMAKINRLVGNSNKKEEVIAAREASRKEQMHLKEEQWLTEIKESREEAERKFMTFFENFNDCFGDLPLLDIGSIVTLQDARKCADLQEVMEEEGYAPSRGKVVEIVDLSKDDFKSFCMDYLESQPFLKGKGGRSSDSKLLQDFTYEEICQRADLKREWDHTSYSEMIMVREEKNDQRYCLVNPEGYDYARYVAIPSSITLVEEGRNAKM